MRGKRVHAQLITGWEQTRQAIGGLELAHPDDVLAHWRQAGKPVAEQRDILGRLYGLDLSPSSVANLHALTSNETAASG